MTTLQQAAQSFKQLFGAKQNKIEWQTAMLGDGHGTVSTGNNMCYVRLTSNSSVIEVLNLKTQPIDGMMVRIAKLPEMPLVWQVTGQDDQRVDENGTGDSGGGGSYNVGPHHRLHEYLGPDQVNIDWRQITTLRVYAAGGMTIGILAGMIPRPGADIVVPTQTLDLTSHVPASGALYVLISIDAAGIITATDGTTVGSVADLTLAYVPDTPAGNFRIAAIRLYSGQSAISESLLANDVRDYRWPQERLAGDVLEQFGVQPANVYLAGPVSGADANPSFRAGVTDDIASGVFPIARGGTNADTAAAAINNLLPSQSGQSGNVLGTDGTNVAWVVGGGGVGGTIVVASLPVGTIVPFGAISIPSGWLECNGAAVSRATYADLFASIGTTYGAGDGSTTFNVPDLRGRSSIGQGTGAGLTPRVIGATGGEESHALSTTEMPAHTHVTRITSDTLTGSNNSTAGQSDGTASADWTSQSAGGGASHNNMPPFVVTAYIIKYTNTATSDLIFNDGVLPADAGTSQATGSSVYAARRDHVHQIDPALVAIWNAKQPAGNYITALTGDGTASGPGSAAFTLTTVNSNVGTFTNMTATVNAKGLITAASSGTAPATGTGTQNYHTKWTGTATLGDSLIQDDGTTTGIGALSSTVYFNVARTSTITAGSINGQSTTLTANPAASSAGIFQGMQFVAQTQAGNAQNFTQSVRGVVGQAQHNGTGTVATLTGVDVQTQINSSGNVTTSRGMRISGVAGSTGRSTTHYGLEIDTNHATTTVNTALSIVPGSAAGNLKYGISIGAISGGTVANVAIETLGGQLQFTHNANSTLATFTGAGTFTATTPLVLLTRNDANTNAIAYAQTLRTNSTGSTTEGFGGRLLWQLKSVTTASQDAGAIDVYWGRNSTPDGVHTFAGRTSTLDLKTVDNAGALTTRLKIYGSLTRIGDASNYLQVNSTGDLLLVGTAKYERHVQVQATPSGNAASQMDSVTIGTATGLKASSTIDQYAGFQWEIPDDWDGTDAYVEIDWFPDSADMSGTAALRWVIEYRAIAEGELVTAGTVATIDNGAGGDTGDYARYQTKHTRMTLTYNNANQPLAAQDHLYFLVHRDTSVANDFSGTVTIPAFEIIYSSNGFPTSN